MSDRIDRAGGLVTIEQEGHWSDLLDIYAEEAAEEARRDAWQPDHDDLYQHHLDSI